MKGGICCSGPDQDASCRLVEESSDNSQDSLGGLYVPAWGPGSSRRVGSSWNPADRSHFGQDGPCLMRADVFRCEQVQACLSSCWPPQQVFSSDSFLLCLLSSRQENKLRFTVCAVASLFPTVLIFRRLPHLLVPGSSVTFWLNLPSHCVCEGEQLGPSVSPPVPSCPSPLCHVSCRTG